MLRKLSLALLTFTLISQSSFSQNALFFDGTNDKVQTGFSGISGTNARTVEAWIKDYLTTTQQVIADWGNMSPNGSRFTVNLINGKLRCEIGGQGVTGPTVIADTQWHHIAVTYDPTATNNFTTYVDGVQDNSFNITIPMNTLTTNAMIIGMRQDNINGFHGWIDEVRVWNYARTQAQIQADMNSEFCSPQSGLVSYFKFDHGVAGGINTGLNTAVDLVSSAQNGTLTGFSLNGATSNWVQGAGLTQGVSTSNLTVTACGSYTAPSGAVYASVGTYTDTINSSFYCDSVITINLTNIYPNSFATINETACGAYTVPSGNATYTADGTYYDTVSSASGCDSILTINLDILNTEASSIVNSCYTYTSPSGNYTWTTSGTYHDTIANAVGCDSILTIQLFIKGTTTANITETACFEYVSPSGKIRTTSGTFMDTITNVWGCDSIININLTVNSFNLNVTPVSNALICGVQNGTYQWVDCDDNSPIAGATGQTFLPTVSGNYAVEVTKLGCKDTSNCYEINLIGIDETDGQKGVKVYPNPSNGQLQLELNTTIFYDLTAYDLLGNKVVQMNNLGGNQKLDFSSFQGVLLLELNFRDGSKTVKRVSVL